MDDVEINVDRNKLEQIDKDITYVLNKARSKAKGERKGIKGHTIKNNYKIICEVLDSND